MLPNKTTNELAATSIAAQLELNYMANKLNVPVQEISRAMKAVGDNRERIQAFLEQFGNRG